MSYYDYSKLAPFAKSGIDPAKVNKAKTIADKIKKLEEEKEKLTEQWSGLISFLEEATTAKAIAEFKSKKGIIIGEAYIATPKFAGKVLKLIVTSVKLNYHQEPVLVAAIIGRDGGVRETKEINPLSWDLIAAKKVRDTQPAS